MAENELTKQMCQCSMAQVSLFYFFKQMMILIDKLRKKHINNLITIS